MPRRSGNHRIRVETGETRDVAKAEPAAAKDAVAEIDQPELVAGDAERADDEAAAPTERGDDADHARADLFQPLAGEGRRQAEKDDGDGKDPDDGAEAPVIGGGGDDAELARQRRVEHRPGIDRTDAQVNGDGRRRNEPSVEAWLRDDVFLLQAVKHVFPPNGTVLGCLIEARAWRRTGDGPSQADFCFATDVPDVGRSGIINIYKAIEKSNEPAPAPGADKKCQLGQNVSTGLGRRRQP